jgi:hypothetical protein
MPVILAEEDWANWLGEELATNDELKALLGPFKDDALTMWSVNRQRIGNVRNKDREVAHLRSCHRRKRHGHVITAPHCRRIACSTIESHTYDTGIR